MRQIAPTQARILVASDNSDDAESVVERLKKVFTDVRSTASQDPDAGLISEFRPDVLVLAFQGLELAEHYFLGLFRSGGLSQTQSCRAIVLCSKDEVARAFESCRKGYFDDYVLHWPLPYDGMRLAMSVLIAAREATRPTRLDGPDTGELIAHVKHLEAVDKTLDANFTSEDRACLEPHMAQVRHLAEKVRRMRLVVLVVEDDPFACEVTEEMLRDQPIELVFAADAPSALTALRRQRPDLILMDIRLPGMDGVTLTKTIKAMPDFSTVPIVMLTGSASKETVAASMGAGAASFLVKPLTRDLLTAKLRQYMAAPSRSA